LQVYLAQRVAPGMTGLANVETAFMDISRVVGGPILFHAMAAILIVANVGSGLTGMAGISRLLYGMGRDRVLPPQIFGHLDAKRSVPTYNILLVGGFVFLCAVFLNYEGVAELINFGAFLAFMGVNAAVIRQFYFLRPKEQRSLLTDVLLPACGLLFCLTIWVSLPVQAKMLGAAWFTAGLLWTGFQTRGFRVPPRMVSFEEG
jgi:putrescine importer